MGYTANTYGMSGGKHDGSSIEDSLDCDKVVSGQVGREGEKPKRKRV